MSHLFNAGDHVLCYEPTPYRAKVLYEAKIVEVVQKKSGEPSYKLRINEWNKIYKSRTRKFGIVDEVAESFLCSVTKKRVVLMNKIAKIASGIKGEVDRTETVRELLVKALDLKTIRQLPPGLQDGDSQSEVAEQDNNLEDSEVEGEHLVTIELQEELKEILENDFNLVKTKHKMSLNGPPVAEVLELFFRSHAHTLLFDRAKNSKDVYKPEKRISLTKEVLEGIRCLFDVILSTNLLYLEEQNSHSRIMSNTDLMVNSKPVSRRQTRSSTAETPQTEAVPPFTQYSTSELKTPAVSQQLFGKLEQHTGTLCDAPSCKKPRLSSLQTSMQNSPSGRSTPTQNLQAEALMKEVSDWRLLPQDLQVKDILPSCKYGAVYLLRLFVKLPDILSKMKLSNELRSFLLTVFHYILSYLVEEKKRLFDSVYYVPLPVSASAL